MTQRHQDKQASTQTGPAGGQPPAGERPPPRRCHDLTIATLAHLANFLASLGKFRNHDIETMRQAALRTIPRISLAIQDADTEVVLSLTAKLNGWIGEICRSLTVAKLDAYMQTCPRRGRTLH